MKSDNLHIGLSISHQNNLSGTLGAFVLNRDDLPCILSCNHVLARNGEIVNMQTPLSRRIFHPGKSEEFEVTEDGHIANVERWQKLRRWRSNRSDSAYASLINKLEIEGNYVPKGYKCPFEGDRIYEVSDDFVPYRGVEVYKIGYATGFTIGRISHIDKGVKVNGFKFTPAIKIEWEDYDKPFSKAGDSGSLVFTKFDNVLCAFGMIFAAVKMENVPILREEGQLPYSYACTLKNILKKNKLSYI